MQPTITLNCPHYSSFIPTKQESIRWYNVPMPRKKLPVYAIGLMSGTSVDGIDGVVLKIADKGELTIHSTVNFDYPKDIKDKIRRLIDRKIMDAQQSENLDTELAQYYAEVVCGLLETIDRKNIAVIGCHGQTIHHSPDSDPSFSLQIGSGAELARLAKIAVVTDFRSADLAAGGQGAPLAPAFHQAAFASKTDNRSVINIGGISNITFLPADDKNDVMGFDTGPGNTLMDYWCRIHFDCDYDNNGEIAESGTIQLDFLDMLLKDAYFEMPPPKSTGLEYFNEQWLKEKLSLWEGRDHATNTDILMTLTALTAKTIADQLNKLEPEAATAYVCGGGAKNRVLITLLKQQTTIIIDTTSALGIDPQWVEAAAFAWMAHRTLNRLTSTLPSVTGASKPTIAGVLSRP
ncbi:anhydro-N-acetylmuramic acid kinase [Candidatus Spongiihabitans sp.]|uniref:anhydro-N-acetylmuramic acid kinase n=1 Tax=Candidatus Spongiihabitans sp. TaxID=3101308 RepID=UPI003C701DCC